MICSSLRKRKDWAHIVPSLSGSTLSKWRESQLGTHDVAFETSSRDGQGVLFRAILLSSADLRLSQTKDRIERLYMLDGGRNAAIVLLLAENSNTASYVELQMEMLKITAAIPIIPIMSAAELPLCLDQLRQQRGTKSLAQRGINKQLPDSELISRCAHGPPLGGKQTNIITDIVSSVGELAQRACDPDGQRQLCDLVGQDGSRVVSFFNPDSLAGMTARCFD